MAVVHWIPRGPARDIAAEARRADRAPAVAIQSTPRWPAASTAHSPSSSTPRCPASPGSRCTVKHPLRDRWTQAHRDAAVAVAACAVLGSIGAVIGALADRRLASKGG